MTTLTMKEEKWLAVIQRVFRGEMTVVEAGMVIGVSERQCYRIKARVKELGTPLPCPSQCFQSITPGRHLRPKPVWLGSYCWQRRCQHRNSQVQIQSPGRSTAEP